MEESKKTCSLSLRQEELFPSTRRDQELPKNEFLKGTVVFKSYYTNTKVGGHTACTYRDFQEPNYENTILLHAE